MYTSRDLASLLLAAGLGLIAFLSESANGNVPPPENSIQSEDDMVFVLGRWFYKNGKPTLTLGATEPQRFSQCMDHFSNGGCQNKWNQRWWIRSDYYQRGGPVFFMFGAEGPADLLIDNYYWHSYARNLGALLVVLEHRFYGESYPSREDSLEVLKLLTSQQALADAAYFIDSFKNAYNLQGSKWVAFGGSYGGNLAAWMKQKYPNHVTAAVSSSGPLLALYDFPGYIETTSDIVRAVDRQCYDRVYNAFECMERLVNGSTCAHYSRPSEILPALEYCYHVDFNDELSRESFFLSLGLGGWAGNWPSAGIKRNCDIIKKITERDPLKAYGKFMVETGASGNCRSSSVKNHITTEEEFVSFLQSDAGEMSGMAKWFWQTCYEFGFYMSADPKHGLFGFNTWSGWPYGSQCRNRFGSQFTKAYTERRIAQTNNFYKGKRIDSKCVIFVNGGWDPWHTLSINRAAETTSDNTVVHIPRAEHCDDMMYPKTNEMSRAQDTIQRQIGRYLNDRKC